MENPLPRMYREMIQDLEKLSGKWMTDFQEEMSKWTQDLLKDAFDPAKMLRFIRGMGVDMSKFGQMFGLMAETGTMPQGFDPYAIFHLDKSATDEEVKKRYRELTFRLHPDQSGTPGTSFLFQMVMAAYELIKKERKWK